MRSIEAMAKSEFAGVGTKNFICPECSEDRSFKNQGKKCLTITYKDKEAVWFCHNCETKGHVWMDEKTELRVVPQFFNASPDSLKVIGKDRGINFDEIDEETKSLLYVSEDVYFSQIGQKTRAVGFGYPHDDGIKWRGLEEKCYTQSGSCRGLFPPFKFDRDEIVFIVEGEYDALAMRSCGYLAFSVPLGANLSAKGEAPHYLKPVINALLRDEIDVVVAVDSDEKGQRFRDALLSFLGRNRIGVIDWSQYGVKDANECLQVHGPEGLRKAFSEIQGILYEGIVRARSVATRIDDIRTGGFKGGAKIGIPSVDRLITVCSDQVTVVTGIPGSGKSELIDFFIVSLAINEGWKFGIFSAENPIDIHCGKLIEKKAGLPLFEGNNRMNEEQLRETSAWVDEHFFFLDPASSNKLDSILDRAAILVEHEKINGIVIDPFNYTDVPLETDAINSMLTKLHAFAGKHHIHVWIVAHPAKLYRGEGGKMPVPGGMDISGSAAWFAKSDFGITVSRDGDGTIMNCWKCRFKWLGDTGTAHLRYHSDCGRYSEGVSTEEIAKSLGEIFKDEPVAADESKEDFQDELWVV